MAPDPNTIALAAVLGTTGTAILVPLINAGFGARADQRRFRHEREAKDLDELRALLDDGSHALTDYLEATNALMTRFALMEPRRFEDYEPHFDVNIAAKARVYTLNRRLVIRLGRHHDVVTAYGAVLKLLDEASTDMATRISEPTRGKADTREEVMVTQDAQRMRWYAAHEHYLDAATALVGSPVRRLGP